MIHQQDVHDDRPDPQGMTRRGVMHSLVALFTPVVLTTKTETAATQYGTAVIEIGPYDPAILPAGIRSRFVNANGLRMHVLEAGFATEGRPLVVLLHGFPELAYSWRKTMPVLAAAGFHVLAPDLRGFGRTSGGRLRYEDDTSDFLFLNGVRDILGLVFASGYRSVAALVGHDRGSEVAAWCALVRPDVFRSLVLLSPFAGAPEPTGNSLLTSSEDPIYDDLAKLTPPRKHYQRYFATRDANDNIWRPPEGVHAFLRAYYHMKSADWKQNRPFALKTWAAAELAQIPRYYVMDLDKGMAETVAAEMPSPAEIAACKWLPDADLRVYSAEYGRTGFQGGLQGYRVRWTPGYTAEIQPSPAAPLTSPRFSSVARAIGASIRDLVRLKRCKSALARGCSASTYLTAQAIGSSRNNPMKSIGYF
jgi:pimeloyl-ACP methyl ester carboxylesterase